MSLNDSEINEFEMNLSYDDEFDDFGDDEDFDDDDFEEEDDEVIDEFDDDADLYYDDVFKEDDDYDEPYDDVEAEDGYDLSHDEGEELIDEDDLY